MQSDVKRSESWNSTAEFLLDIWAHQLVGYVELVAVNDDVPGGKRKPYWLRSDNVQHLRRILAKHPYWDWYFTPHTFSKEERKRKYVLTPRLVHADVLVGQDTEGAWKVWDVGDERRKRAAREDAEYRLFGRQALWKAPRGASLEDIEALCQDRDPTALKCRWHLTRLLACPPVVLDAPGLIDRYNLQKLRLLMKSRVDPGNRGRWCFKLACECIKSGLDFDQTRLILEASQAFQSKRDGVGRERGQGERWAQRELQRLPGRAFAALERERA